MIDYTPTKSESEYLQAIQNMHGVTLTEEAKQFAILLLRANEEQLATAIEYLKGR